MISSPPAGMRCVRHARRPEASVIYETHLRDFSASDASLPAALRGTYAAFTRPDSNGMRHLRDLQKAGLTHVQLLPVFDIATIDEDPARRINLDDLFAALRPLGPDAPALGAVLQRGEHPSGAGGLRPASGRAQSLYNDLRGLDDFNWGYDPSTSPRPRATPAMPKACSASSSSARWCRPCRQRPATVMDVVYNHTNASGG